jgi:hypothetical protein
LQPFCDDVSIEFDEALIGDWENAGDRTWIRVDRAEWKSYKIVYTSPTGPVVLTGFLTRVGEGRVLDQTPGRPLDSGALFIPAHVALRVQVLGDTLTATGLDYDWFLHETELGRLTKLRPALDSRKNVMLTADTASLRAWLAAQARDGEIFGDATRFVRKRRERMAENTQAGELRRCEWLCYNLMSCAYSSNPASEISGGFHAAAPASAR